MMNEKFYTCKYDRAFKEIMLSEKNKIILKKLLEQILKVEITEIVIKPTELNTANLEVKRKTLDVLLTTNVGKIGIEVNGFRKDYVKPRNMAYICDVYASNTLVGETYNEDTKIIQINFSYGLSKGNNKVKPETKPYRIYKMQDDELKQFVENFMIYEINMDYYKDLWYHGDKKEIEESKYIIMLNLGEKELKEISKKDKVAERYMEELVNLNKNPEFREYMSAEEDARKIYNTEIKEALEQGIEQGKKNKQIEIAQKLLEQEIPVDIIKITTGLNDNEIEELK